MLLASTFALVAASGCARFDLFDPYTWGHGFTGEWTDTVAGLESPTKRIERIESLAKSAPRQPVGRQEAVAQELAGEIRQEADPMIRASIVRALGHFEGETAQRVLSAAVEDSDPQVRIAACEALAQRGGGDDVGTLSGVLRSDLDQDVRLAAAKALGQTEHQRAVVALGDVLDDRDPALQYRAIASLKRVSGEDYGNDVGQWKRFAQRSAPADREILQAERSQPRGDDDGRRQPY